MSVAVFPFFLGLPFRANTSFAASLVCKLMRALIRKFVKHVLLQYQWADCNNRFVSACAAAINPYPCCRAKKRRNMQLFVCLLFSRLNDMLNQLMANVCFFAF